MSNRTEMGWPLAVIDDVKFEIIRRDTIKYYQEHKFEIGCSCLDHPPCDWCVYRFNEDGTTNY